jgi:hypothetical protein
MAFATQSLFLGCECCYTYWTALTCKSYTACTFAFKFALEHGQNRVQRVDVCENLTR